MKLMHLLSHLVSILLVTTTGLSSPKLSTALAQTASPPRLAWTGLSASSNQWSDAANWRVDDPPGEPPRAPRDGDVLVFDGSAAARLSDNDLDGLSLAGLEMDSSGYTLTGLGIGLDGPIIAESDFTSGTSEVRLPLALWQEETRINVSGASTTLRLTGAITGISRLVKRGSGALALEGTNTFMGGVRVEAGQVNLVHHQSAGSGEAQVQSGAALIVQSASQVANPLRLENGGSLRLSLDNAMDSAEAKWLDPVTLSGTGVVDVCASCTLILSNILQGTGDLIKRGAGKLRFIGEPANTYQGKLIIEAGVVDLMKNDGVVSITGALEILPGADASHLNQVHTFNDNQFATGSTVSMAANTLLHLHGRSQTLRGLSGAYGAVTLDEMSEGRGRLTLAPQPYDTFSLANPTISGYGKLTINAQAHGSQAVDGNDSPKTRLFMGTVNVNGPGTFTGLNFRSGARLAMQDGTTALWYGGYFETISAGPGMLRLIPGEGPGEWISTGGLSLGEGAAFEAVLYSSQTQALASSGTVELDGADFSLVCTATAFPWPNVPQVLIANGSASPVAGIFNALPDGTRLECIPYPPGGTQDSFIIHYNGGDGNDVTLTRLPRAALQISAPPTVPFGSSVELTARLVPETGMNLPAGVSARFYCDRKLAGSANFQGENAFFRMPLLETRVGPLACYAEFPGTTSWNRAVSETVVIEITGNRVLIPAVRR